MAKSITFSALLQLVGDGVNISGGGVAKTIAQIGANNIGNIQAIGTSVEAVVLGDVATVGYIFLQNQDATNFVEVDVASPITSPAVCHLKPGECALIPTRTATWYAKADTATVNLFVLAVDL